MEAVQPASRLGRAYPLHDVGSCTRISVKMVCLFGWVKICQKETVNFNGFMVFSVIYFFKDAMPKSFDTPIFWGEDDLAELKGTCVVGWSLLLSIAHLHHILCHFHEAYTLIKFAPEKLGRDQAEKDYREKVLPAVQVRQFVNQRCKYP